MTSPALTLFGKLPSAGDFVRIGPQPDAVRVFNEWVERGLFVAQNRLGDAWEANLAWMPTWSFLFAPPDCAHVLVGAARFSSDRVGRTYPFCAALLLDRASLDPREAPAWPVRWRYFQEHAAYVVERAVVEAISPDHLAADLPPLAAAAVPVPLDAHRNHMAATPSADVWAATWQDQPEVYAGVSLAQLAAHLVPLRQRDPSRFPLGLRCALPAGAADRASDVALWCEMAWALLGSPPLWPSLFWVAGDYAPSDLLLFLRPPLPQAFPALLDAQAAYDRVLPLDYASGAVPPVALPIDLAEPGLSLSAVIEGLRLL